MFFSVRKQKSKSLNSFKQTSSYTGSIQKTVNILNMRADKSAATGVRMHHTWRQDVIKQKKSYKPQQVQR